MREILEEFRRNDLLLFSFPLYCHGIPAPLKALIDRTMPMTGAALSKADDRYEHTIREEYAHLRYLMISGCGFPNSRHNFEPAAEEFRLKFPYGHTVITIPESTMFCIPQASPVTEPRLELVRKAGKQYAETGKIEETLLEEIGSPMIPEDLYIRFANDEAQ